MWEELLKRWWVADPFRPTEEARRYYETKHRIAERLQPRSIVEIGVRAGYSAYAFLHACPKAYFLGIDWGIKGAFDEANRNEVAFCSNNVERLMSEFPSFRMIWNNSHHLGGIPAAPGGGVYEFAHVDADHSYEGCTADLKLTKDCKWVLVDDFDVGPEVRGACRDWLLAHPELKAEYIPDGFRGQLLIERR